jgi:hypothetical protein
VLHLLTAGFGTHATWAHVRCYVGFQGRSGLVVLAASISGRDP